jgi:hypothetical protein
MNDNCGCKISGIKCEVENCRHHTIDNCCDAGCIKVGPHKADCSSDTCCDTFEQK